MQVAIASFGGHGLLVFPTPWDRLLSFSGPCGHWSLSPLVSWLCSSWSLVPARPRLWCAELFTLRTGPSTCILGSVPRQAVFTGAVGMVWLNFCAPRCFWWFGLREMKSSLGCCQDAGMGKLGRTPNLVLKIQVCDRPWFISSYL